MVTRNLLTVLAALMLLSGNLGAAICGFSCAMGAPSLIHHHPDLAPGQSGTLSGHEHHHHAAGAPCNEGGPELQLTAADCGPCGYYPQAIFQKTADVRLAQKRLISAGSPGETSQLLFSAILPFYLYSGHIKAPTGEHEQLASAPFSLRI